MKIERRSVGTLLVALILLFLGASASHGGEMSVAPGTPAAGTSKENTPFPALDLPPPQSQSERAYLGISEVGAFRVNQIKAPVLIIEVFNFYCPHCRRVAPLVDKVYREIQGRPDLKERVKLIGIGLANNAYEVNLFKEKYKVPFPLFPDKDMAILKKIVVSGTPTFIGVKVNEQGLQEWFYLHPGTFDDPSKFLAEIITLSGLK
jgi:thiol-disulfide isomerase/thioredoxin